MLRYKKLGYIVLNVTDLKRSLEFYRDVVGLEHVQMADKEKVYLTCSNDYYDIILCQSDQPGLKRIAFEMENALELEKAYDYLQSLGIKVIDVDDQERRSLLLGKVFRFRDPSGTLIEFYSGKMERPVPFKAHPIKIIKLDHIVLKVPDFEKNLAFYTDTLNFKVSDYRYKPNGDLYFAFMRCFPNPYHHSFGLVASDQLQFFHLAFKVTDIDDLGRGRNRLIDANVPITFGPGRHLASGSIFMYFLDPDGLTLEYTLGMEEFPEDGAREPRMLDSSMATTDMWEGKVDPRTGKIGYVEVSD